jgi:hypothetical protein
MNHPYQRILKDNKLTQPGEIDTLTKFTQLTQGVSFRDKTVLDIGCHLGMMCKLATDKGAVTKGIDNNLEVIKSARETFPGLSFYYGNAETISENYDIIIASAVVHYFKDLEGTFKLFARCSNLVICDIWLSDSLNTDFKQTSRGIFIPSKSAFIEIANKYFRVIRELGPALSPDNSSRFIFHLSDPIKTKPKALLITGDGNSGKSNFVNNLFNYSTFSLDLVTHNWLFYNQSRFQSVSQFSSFIRGNFIDEYLNYFKFFITNWLNENINRDIAIEGFDLKSPDLYEIIKGLLTSYEIEEVHL